MSRSLDNQPLGAGLVAARTDPDRFRAVAGRERGELLELSRGPSGGVERMHFATYALTRTPTAFADLLG